MVVATLLVTPSTGRTDTYTGCFDSFHGIFKNWRCRENMTGFFEHSVDSQLHIASVFFTTPCVFTVCVHGITVNPKCFVRGSHSGTGG